MGGGIGGVIKHGKCATAKHWRATDRKQRCSFGCNNKDFIGIYLPYL